MCFYTSTYLHQEEHDWIGRRAISSLRRDPLLVLLAAMLALHQGSSITADTQDSYVARPSQLAASRQSCCPNAQRHIQPGVPAADPKLGPYSLPKSLNAVFSLRRQSKECEDEVVGAFATPLLPFSLNTR
jgi:hypothetical protein